MQDYRNLAADLVAALKKQGADAADVYVVTSTNFNSTVRLGKIERLQQATTKGLGMRVIKGGAMANTFTTDFADRAVKDLARETMEIVKISNADKSNGLAPRELLGLYEGKLTLFDDSLAKLEPQKKVELVRAAEEAGLQYDKRIKNGNGSRWSDTRGQVTLANSDGFIGQYQGTTASMSVGLLAQDEDGSKQTDFWYSVARFFKDLATPESIGKEAGRRVIGKMGARKPKSATVPVVVDPMVSSSLVAEVFGAAAGDSVYRRTSYLVDKVGQTIASPLVTVVDDATIPDGISSRPFDGEGVRSSRVMVVEGGVLKQYVCDSYSARRLNVKPSGNAGRGYTSVPYVTSTNLYLKNGDTSPADIIKSVKNGFYITAMFGSGMNSVTGDFSQGATGFWIENGELTYPVQETTIAGNVLKALQNVKVVGNDLSFKLGSPASPTLLISEMTVGGV
jgi:PmbA protein